MTILDLEKILKGQEQIIGGFDLIYKGKNVSLPASSTYSTLLGAKNNRLENLKKLAKSTALRLSKQYLQKQQKQIAQNQRKKVIKVTTKIKSKTIPPQPPRLQYVKKEDDEKSTQSGFKKYKKQKSTQKVINKQEQQEQVS